MRHFRSLVIVALWAPVLLLFLIGCDSNPATPLPELPPSDPPPPEAPALQPQDFFPLAVGNEWHTLGTIERTGLPTITERIRYESTEEVEPGRFAVRVTTVSRVSGEAPVTTVSEVVWYYDSGTQQVLERAGEIVRSLSQCPLSMLHGDSRWCGRAYERADTLVAVGSQPVRMAVKGFSYYSDSWSEPRSLHRSFALGIGPISFRESWIIVQQYPSQPPTYGEDRSWKLRYARISTKEYGQPLF